MEFVVEIVEGEKTWYLVSIERYMNTETEQVITRVNRSHSPHPMEAGEAYWYASQFAGVSEVTVSVKALKDLDLN